MYWYLHLPYPPIIGASARLAKAGDINESAAMRLTMSLHLRSFFWSSVVFWSTVWWPHVVSTSTLPADRHLPGCSPVGVATRIPTNTYLT